MIKFIELPTSNERYAVNINRIEEIEQTKGEVRLFLIMVLYSQFSSPSMNF